MIIAILQSDVINTTDSNELRKQYINNYDCPLARAIKRIYPEVTKIEVGGDELFIDDVVYRINDQKWSSGILIELMNKTNDRTFPYDVELTKQ